MLAALADKEAVIMELLDRVHLLEGADPEGTGGVGVSEDLMNHNQKLEGTISWLEVRGGAAGLGGEWGGLEGWAKGCGEGRGGCGGG